MGIQLHDGFAAFDVSFPRRGKKSFEEICIDGCDRPPQFSESCAFGNARTSMGSPRRHSEFLSHLSTFFPTTTYVDDACGQRDVGTLWDSLKAYGVGGRSLPPLPYFLCPPHIHIF
jgi:hypothetical protein